MPGYLRPFLHGGLCSAGVLGIGLIVPFWARAQEVRGSVVVMESVPLWWVLTEPPPAPGAVEPEWARKANRGKCLTLLMIAGLVGAGVFWARWPRSDPAEAPDYFEGPGVSARDGRSPA